MNLMVIFLRQNTTNVISMKVLKGPIEQVKDTVERKEKNPDEYKLHYYQ